MLYTIIHIVCATIVLLNLFTGQMQPGSEDVNIANVVEPLIQVTDEHHWIWFKAAQSQTFICKISDILYIKTVDLMVPVGFIHSFLHSDLTKAL